MEEHKLCHQTYTKINTLYKRDEKGNIVIGDFSLPEFKYLYNNKWLAFEKVDGTNMSFYWDGHEMQIHGKSENASIPSILMDTMKTILTEEKLAEVFPIKYDENGNEVPFMVRIYGEGYGAKIQKCGGLYTRSGNDFRVFDIKINGFWLDWDNVVDITNKLGLKTVEPFGEMTLEEADDRPGASGSSLRVAHPGHRPELRARMPGDGYRLRPGKARTRPVRRDDVRHEPR